MADIEFFDVKGKKRVSINDSNITKTMFEGAGGRKTYAIRGKTEDGRYLTKFVSKASYDEMTVKEEAAPKKEPKADTKAAAPKSTAKKTSTKEASDSKATKAPKKTTAKK